MYSGQFSNSVMRIVTFSKLNVSKFILQNSYKLTIVSGINEASGYTLHNRMYYTIS